MHEALNHATPHTWTKKGPVAATTTYDGVDIEIQENNDGAYDGLVRGDECVNVFTRKHPLDAYRRLIFHLFKYKDAPFPEGVYYFPEEDDTGIDYIQADTT